MLASDEIAPGYWCERVLTPGGTFLCATADGRRYVLKRLPADCLHEGAVHPAIRERLARVRELPHARVATLVGVVRGTAATAYLVWSHVQGRPWDQVTGPAGRPPRLTRGLVAAVSALHARGLVHGAVHGRNVIVSPAGDVWLTHISPYLWDDMAEDVRAVDSLLGATAELPLPFTPGPMNPSMTDAPPAVTEFEGNLGSDCRWAMAAAAGLLLLGVVTAVLVLARVDRATRGRPPDGFATLVAPAQ